MSDPRADPARRYLFGMHGTSVYALLDGASVPDLPRLLWQHEPEHVCLYSGELEPDMAEVAPYLIRLHQKSGFCDVVLEQCWGHHWGVFAVAPLKFDLHAARKHFRRFLMVKTPNGTKLNFRYYDPRVLRVYLPTCNVQELDFVFGAVGSFFMEDETPDALLRFSRAGDALRTQSVALPAVTNGSKLPC